MSALEKMKQARLDIIEQQKKIADIAQEAFKELFENVFSKFPEIESFSWQQYTPYFNDGDECIFRLYIDSDSLKINDKNGYDIYHDWRKLPDSEYGEISEMLNELDSEDYKTAFGDHVEITVSKRGDKIIVEAEEYNHD